MANGERFARSAEAGARVGAHGRVVGEKKREMRRDARCRPRLESRAARAGTKRELRAAAVVFKRRLLALPKAEALTNECHLTIRSVG